ncbi:uncharacterized protein K452DRAFT_336050 [Aplosporella prunicola CBS 121167]|uniref:Uncharacterized protein n=1 Tax=Aplosporella prunicola CBS 121167 TaxID=1176127 RepID=A0A6A6BAV9_9PEZI|nr:uncharacterized protein K452DRAFT_336050 [Aplosporella prunicola CBS 121167]KAF2140047.1 hypothetical protein K452DRAFT_336050 [Aplosporella prunicola CBS 121167]
MSTTNGSHGNSGSNKHRREDDTLPLSLNEATNAYDRAWIVRLLHELHERFEKLGQEELGCRKWMNDRKRWIEDGSKWEADRDKLEEEKNWWMSGRADEYKENERAHECLWAAYGFIHENHVPSEIPKNLLLRWPDQDFDDEESHHGYWGIYNSMERAMPCPGWKLIEKFLPEIELRCRSNIPAAKESAPTNDSDKKAETTSPSSDSGVWTFHSWGRCNDAWMLLSYMAEHTSHAGCVDEWKAAHDGEHKTDAYERLDQTMFQALNWGNEHRDKNNPYNFFEDMYLLSSVASSWRHDGVKDFCPRTRKALCDLDYDEYDWEEMEELEMMSVSPDEMMVKQEEAE